MPFLLYFPALLFATLGPLVTKLVLIGLPCSLFWTHHTWTRRGPTRSRTRLFYVWALTSAALIFSVYIVVVVGFREVLLWETMIVTTMFGTTVSFLRCAKGNPGVVKRAKTELHRKFHEDYNKLEGKCLGKKFFKSIVDSLLKLIYMHSVFSLFSVCGQQLLLGGEATAVIPVETLLTNSQLLQI